MVADIRSVDNDAEVVRLGRLIQTYQARISELSVQRERGMMADGAMHFDRRPRLRCRQYRTQTSVARSVRHTLANARRSRLRACAGAIRLGSSVS